MPAPRIRAFAPLLLILALACQPTTPSPSPPTASTAPSAAAYPLTLTDDAGRQVTLPAEPGRIVSLAPSNTEIVCALDACDRLVGVTDFDDYPAEVADIPDVVIFAVVDIELVVDADPDLILAAGNELTPSAVITELTDLGYPVLVLYPESLDEVLENIELIGEAISARDQAAALTADMEDRIQAVTEAVGGATRPRTFYEVGVFEGAIYTAGEDSFLASVITVAGGDPITGDPLTTSIALEDLLVADPELILLGDAAYDPSVTPEAVAARQGWGAISAVQNGQIVVMLRDPVITRPGPRIVDGLEALARAIHPDRFD
ncbi:MAG TPA: ABC transporter substrate-binding protein [Pleomorphomonadaceae bacterium]|nr:ABC transporter substrate-binding protein [Pleomorphomonadaceae bacterium]